MTKNKMNYSGSFYPDKKDELLKYFEFFNQNQQEINLDIKARAIIVPHAGYIYSGIVANIAYSKIKDLKPKRVIVIGPSHRHYLSGASVSLFDKYETPLGDMNIDKEFGLDLIKKYDCLDFDENAHMEHSTETQMPFIKNYLDTKVLEIVYGKLDYKELSNILLDLFKDEDNFVVISTDLSHFYSLEEANILDQTCIDAIKNKDLIKIDEGCEACGIIGVKALLETSKEFNFEIKFLEYKTSCEMTKDRTSVVGYASFLVGENIGI
ncbi:AmmeMemoRadiSam system protein B [uncultured Arcobacter sp.]|uniref:AmmeMemoRadiSam system protein B n=1 Tax=uncultured Arcobacter sp. TaxID=165434 RepID=UPI00260A8517|nr:AmmeMemoRadiSam system protein B [uncultured Arcobacter sp.]